MPPTTTYEFGDVIFVPFPYSDLTGSKKRPAVVVGSPAFKNLQAVVISPGTFNQVRLDLLLVVPVTSNTSGGFDSVSIVDWVRAGLVGPSVAKPNFQTILKDRVIRKIGKLSDEDKEALRAF